MAVHITGSMGLPSGAVYPNCEMYFERKVGVVSQSGYAVVPEKTIVRSNASALVDFYLLYGEYIGTIQTTLGVVKFAFSVLDVASATFISCIGDVSVPIPADSVQVAIDAAASASAAAANAALYDGIWFDDLPSVTADTVLSYTAGAGKTLVAPGDYVKTREEGWAYQVLSSGSATYDAITADGVKVDLLTNVADFPGSIAAPYVTKSARLHKIFGVLRQRTDDRTKWQFLDDTAHKPLGFDSTYPLYAFDGTTVIGPKASGNNLLVFYKNRTDNWKTTMSPTVSYDLVGNCLVTADELLTKDWGITLGAQVTRTGITIQGSMHKTRTMRVYYNGSSWVVTNDALQTFGTVTTSYDTGTGVLTVTHDWLPGQSLRVDPDGRSGLITTMHMPVRREVVSDTSFTVQFRDWAGAIITGAATTAMSFRAEKAYHGALYMDGTNGFDAIPWSTADAGNIWISGEMWAAT